MHAEKSHFSIVRMARLLEVSRAGYYAWLGRARSARAAPAQNRRRVPGPARDTLVVTKLDRLARSRPDARAIGET